MSDLAHAHDALYRYIEAIHALVLGIESRDASAEVVASAEHVLHDVLETLDGLDALLQAEEASAMRDISVIGTRDEGRTHDALGDFVFMTRSGIARRLGTPLFAEPHEALSFDVADRLVAYLHETYKGLVALEAVLASRLETSPKSASLLAKALRIALRTRHAYVGLREHVCSLAPETEAQACEAVRAIEGVMRGFVESGVFKHIRVHDRRALLALYERLEAFGSEPGAEDASSLRQKEATRLHQDVLATLNLLFGINLRGEIVEHDRLRVGTALAALRALPRRQSAVPLAIRAPLARLTGRSRALDTLLAQHDGVSREALEAVLTELEPTLMGSGVYAF